MKYAVVITPAAEADIALAFTSIEDRSPLNARRWLHGLYKMIRTLEAFPKRCGRAREADLMGEELRQTVFKSHRIIFRVEEDPGIVWVLHVRHGARATLSSDEPREEGDL